MDFLKSNIGRRHFISISSAVLGAGMLGKQSKLLFAAEGPPQATVSAKSDGTKYGKYIILSEKQEATERGTTIININSSNVPETHMTAITGRMPPPGPMPGHESTEKHENPEFLIHLGNNPDDPMDLGADVELYLGKGKWREKFTFNRATAVYLPAGFWHCPWHVKKIKREMTWVNVQTGIQGMASGPPSGVPQEGAGPGGGPGGGQGGAPPMMDQDAISPEELAKAKTGNYIFDKHLLSGVVKDKKDPKGGKWIAYLDCTMIAEAPLTRIIRYNPEEAPYSILDAQTHEYETFLIIYGTDLNDPTNLGAEVELCMGEEKEKHIFNKSAIVYVPADTLHGPLKVTKASRPFNFLEIVGGPELPGAVYG